MRIQKRTLFIGVIVWLLFFGWWFRGFLFRNWQFRLFSFSSWRHLIREFKAGWQISSKSDWIFLFSFILAPFIFSLLWYWAQKIKWYKIWKKIWSVLRWPLLVKKKKKLKAEISAYTPKQPYAAAAPYRPVSMPITNGRIQPMQEQKTFLNNSTAMGNFSTPTMEPEKNFSDNFPPMPSLRSEPEQSKAAPFTNADFAEMADTPLSEIEIPQMEPVKEDIFVLLEKAGYTLLNPIMVGDKQSDFVAVSATDLVIALYDKDEGDWLADEESFNDEDPLWFSETDHRTSPVFLLKQTANVLQEKLGGLLNITPILIEQSGTIINAEDMMKTWNDLGVVVCRTGMGGPIELPTGSEIFKEPQEKISEELLEKIKSIL